MTENDVVELLERQCAFLLAQSGTNFFVRLRAFIHIIRNVQRLSAHLDAIADERTRDRDAYFARLRRVDSRLLAIRKEFAIAAPHLDNSRKLVAEQADDPFIYTYSLAAFDQALELARKAKTLAARPDDSRLLGPLRSRINEYDRTDHEAAHPFNRRVSAAETEYNFIARELKFGVSQAAGEALDFIDRMTNALNPDPVDNGIWKHRGVEPEGADDVRKALFDGDARVQIETIVNEYKGHVSTLAEELRRRIGTARSHLAIVHRFKTRAEWYERDALRAAVTDRDKTGRRENYLSSMLAQHVFDAGLTPLTRPMVGRLQPDIFVPGEPKWSFYVEAKQYQGSSKKSYLVNGVKQVWDTVGTLRGTRYELLEAFYVVFRVGAGTRYVFPDSVRAEGVTLFPIMIDIAPVNTIGSRQKHPAIPITEAELLPRLEKKRASK